MAKPLLLSIGSGKVQELVGTAESQVPVWDATLSEWQAAAVPGGGGGGGVTSVGLTGGTSGIVIGGTASPITSTGTFNLDAPLRFAFNTATPTEVAAAGQVSYNADEGSLEQMFDGGQVKAVIGQALYQRVLNNTGSTLSKGQVVYVSGAQGNRVTVSLALADADSTSATIIGIVAYAIADEAEGYVITEGVIKGVVTTGYTEGLPVYLSPTTPGALTQTKPVAPDHLVLVGYCVRADATTGEILVKTQNGYELGELHDVYINSPTSGQILIYDGTSGQTRWENASLTAGSGIAVSPGPGSLSVGFDSTSSPTLTGITLSGLTASRFVVTNGSSALASQQYVSLSSEVSGTLPATNGGTAQSTWATGDMLYASAANTLAKRTIGSTGDVLTVVGGVPTWQAPATSGTVTSVSTVTTGMGLTMAVTNETTTPTITLAGTLSAAKGGTGVDLSASTGILAVLGGTVSAREISNGDISASAEIGRGKLASADAYRVVVNGATGHLSQVASTGTAGQYLASGGASALPTWASIPYDIAGEAVGSVSVDEVVFHFIAPRNFTMTALSQASTASAVLKIQVNGTDASYPQAVTTGQTVTAKVTTAGTDVWFTVTGNV